MIYQRLSSLIACLSNAFHENTVEPAEEPAIPHTLRGGLTYFAPSLIHSHNAYLENKQTKSTLL